MVIKGDTRSLDYSSYGVIYRNGQEDVDFLVSAGVCSQEALLLKIEGLGFRAQGLGLRSVGLS